MRKIVILLFVLLVLGICTITTYGSESEQEDLEVVDGKVVSIIKDSYETLDTSGGGYTQKVQILNVKLTKGNDKGKIIEVHNYIDSIMAYSLEVEVGDEIYCMLERDTNGEIVKGYIYEMKRDKYIIYLIVIFIALMILVGGLKGLKSLITLSITIVGIYYMLKGIINGMNPILISIIIAIIVTIITMFIIAGFNKKAISAIIGTLGGVVLSGIIALIVGNYANLSGISSTEAQMLLFSPNSIALDFKGILFASILLGTLGAVMDVCMSIASAITELKEANTSLETKYLFKSGMNIGKDVMGTMSNTLILAYAGTSMCLLLLFMVNDMPFKDIINMDMIATEVVRALSGTIGLIISIPITALASSMLVRNNNE